MTAMDMKKIIQEINAVQLLNYIDRIPGFLSFAEGYTLMSLASMDTSDAAVVELGSFKGKSTCWLAAGCRKRGRGIVTAVDHFCGSPEHQKGGIEETPEVACGDGTRGVFDQIINTFGFSDIVSVRQRESADVADWSQKIRLLFIDGDHSYAGTKNDFYSWRPFVESGGIVCFHDYENILYLEGVTKFINTEIAPNYEFIGRIESLVMFKMS